LGRGEQSFAEGVCYGLAGHLGPLVGRKSVQDRALNGGDRHPLVGLNVGRRENGAMDSNPTWPLPAQPSGHRNGEVHTRGVRVGDPVNQERCLVRQGNLLRSLAGACP
jgi:hypothetical protein